LYRVTLTYYLDVDRRQIAELHTDGVRVALQYNKPEVHDVSWKLEQVDRSPEPDLPALYDDPETHRQIHSELSKPRKELPRGEDK
jgi:hypothetical protein